MENPFPKPKNMFINQKEVIEKTTQYLDSKKEAGIETFKKLGIVCQTIQPKFVLLMMPHENLEAYIKNATQFEIFHDFKGVISNYEMEAMQRYDYNEENAHEDYLYWETAALAGKLFEMWLSHCFHAAKLDKQLSIPFFYVRVPESEEVFHLNECKKKLNKTAYEQQHKLNLKFNVLDIGL